MSRTVLVVNSGGRLDSVDNMTVKFFVVVGS